MSWGPGGCTAAVPSAAQAQPTRPQLVFCVSARSSRPHHPARSPGPSNKGYNTDTREPATGENGTCWFAHSRVATSLQCIKNCNTVPVKCYIIRHNQMRYGCIWKHYYISYSINTVGFFFFLPFIMYYPFVEAIWTIEWQTQSFCLLSNYLRALV